MCKGIQVRLQSNESLKKIEIRFIVLARKFLESIFKAMANNKALQKLILTHDALKLGTGVEFKLLGEALKVSPSIIMVDYSHNSEFDETLEFHEAITEQIINAKDLKLRKIILTTTTVDIKTHYLELKD